MKQKTNMAYKMSLARIQILNNLLEKYNSQTYGKKMKKDEIIQSFRQDLDKLKKPMVSD